MQVYRVIVTAAAIVALGATTSSAQGRSGSAPGHMKAPKTTRPNGGGRPDSPGKSGSAPGHMKDKPGGGQDKKADKDASGTPAPGTAGAKAPNLIAAKISDRPELLARVSTLLPAGMTLEQASAGFRNQGQFMAALNASKNRGLPFADLQKAMTVDGLSLGQAARQLKPPAPTAPKS